MSTEMSQFHSGLICRDFSEHKYLQKRRKVQIVPAALFQASGNKNVVLSQR